MTTPGQCRPLWRDAQDRGSATAELALVVPALVLVAGLCLSAIGAVATHIRCLDAARAAAREAARGEDYAAVRALAQQRAPGSATVSLTRTGQLVVVEVRARVGLLGGADTLGVEVGGAAVAGVEEPLPP